MPTNRVFRYAQNGKVALTPGIVVQAERPNGNHSNMACAAAAVGATSVTVTPLDTVLNGDYAEGYVFINDAAGEGVVYDVLSHPDSIAESTLALRLKDQVAVALTTSSQATLVKNIYKGVNLPGGTPWDIIAGVSPVAVAADAFFWCQVSGPAAVLQEGSLFAGRGVMLSRSRPGAMETAKQVVPVVADARSQRVSGGTDSAPSVPAATVEYSQKGLERSYALSRGVANSTNPEEFMVNVGGKATIPERVLGYCINPRVSREFALIYLTIS